MKQKVHSISLLLIMRLNSFDPAPVPLPASDLYAFAPATVHIPAIRKMADMRAIVCDHLVQAKTFIYEPF